MSSTPPLADIRILDLSWVIAGPLTTRLLADFGAQVIKIESRRRMDIARANRIPLFGVLPGDANTNPDTGGYFQDSNAGKLSCTLNLATPSGLELLHRLVTVSDVIVCNLAGDLLAKWGVDYEHARVLNPGIIVVDMPSMETAGPRAGWRGFGEMFVGMAGLKSVTGEPGQAPRPWGHQYADFSSNPFHAAIAILAAIEDRRRTGEGQFIEVSQYESTAALMGPAFLDYGVSGEAPQPTGNRTPEACPHNIYPCAGDDEWVAIAVFDDGQWEALTAFAGIDELRAGRLATLAGRKASEDELDAVLARWTATLDRHTLASSLQARGVPAGAVEQTSDLVRHDGEDGRPRRFVEAEHPAGRTFLVHNSPLAMQHAPAGVTRAPLIGEHTFEVLTTILGMTPDEIAHYAAAEALD